MSEHRVCHVMMRASTARALCSPALPCTRCLHASHSHPPLTLPSAHASRSGSALTRTAHRLCESKHSAPRAWHNLSGCLCLLSQSRSACTAENAATAARDTREQPPEERRTACHSAVRGGSIGGTWSWMAQGGGGRVRLNQHASDMAGPAHVLCSQTGATLAPATHSLIFKLCLAYGGVSQGLVLC